MKCQISADLRRHVLHEELLQCRNQSEFWVHEWRILRGGQECVWQNGEDRVQVSWKLTRAWGDLMLQLSGKYRLFFNSIPALYGRQGCVEFLF